MTTPELAPCLFCDNNGQFKFSVMESDIEGFYNMHCFRCGATGPNDETIEGAEQAWNHRTRQDPVKDRLVEALERIVYTAKSIDMARIAQEALTQTRKDQS